MRTGVLIHTRSSLGQLGIGLLLALLIPLPAASQRNRLARTIDAGTTITVRTNEAINTSNSDGQVFTGAVDQDVMDRSGRMAIPRGSEVEMLVRQLDSDSKALDLDTVIVNGQRYGTRTEESMLESERKEGIGVNSRTGKYVGGGALIGAVIGALAGGGKGAAIGAGTGAAAGAGVQVLTRGRRVQVPAESLLTFRLAEPLELGVRDLTFMRNGRRYNQLYSAADRPVYENDRYNSDQSAYGLYSGPATLRIVGQTVTWQSPEEARVFVQVDNERRLKLFSEGRTGSQQAPWISEGSSYTFIMRDFQGNELARQTLDLRRAAPYRRYR